MLNARGGVECDFTVTRLAEERFRIVTGTAFGQHDGAWIRSHAPDDGTVSVEDVTSKYACLGLWGPRARDILQPLTTTPLDFPYMRARELAVGSVPCTALRVTYVGELGWELYCPTEFGLRLWDELWAAGREHGLVAGGYRAIDSLRLEKGYRVWGADITPDETPYEGGVGFCVKLGKEGGFIGRDALAAAKEEGPRTRLVCLLLEDPRSVALSNEPVRIGGETELSLRAGALRDPVLLALGLPVLRCGAVMRPGDDGQRAAVAALAENAAGNGVEVTLGDDGALVVPGESASDPVAFTLGLA